MAIYNYKRYKIAIQVDSKKVQGLRTGDVVRRQYWDGNREVYSLMCVLEHGKETDGKAYFVGALLDGAPPQSSELLDFARITSLTDANRSGALYLTASDEQSPYMDVIDGIGRNASLCWPNGLASDRYVDTESQYVFRGEDALTVTYLNSFEDCLRVCQIQRTSQNVSGFVGLQQDFYHHIQNPDRVLVSYRIKSTKATKYTVSLGYQDGTRVDGTVTEQSLSQWQYKFHAITVDYSGRYLRSVKLDLGQLKAGDEVWIADLNIILLSSLTNFNDASKLRIGKLDGINDPVFGELEGYGGYMQKLFASKVAHISGTLTAGDENGFAATFYAGRIHRNVFPNSLDVVFTQPPAGVVQTPESPVGMGKVYSLDKQITMVAQSRSWAASRIGKTYTFSCWLYGKSAGSYTLIQNGVTVGILNVDKAEVGRWKRRHISFRIQLSASDQQFLMSLAPAFTNDSATEDRMAYFTAPQLEAGEYATQYQPTDSVLNYTEDYGAWFSRGGIGGTIQNPLLQLNFDGKGGIGTRSGSFLINTDGSGHFANQNIRWDKRGNVTFGSGVKMAWENLDAEAQDKLTSKSIRIIGPDTFTVTSDLMGSHFSPASIKLTLESENVPLASSVRKWYVLNGSDYELLDGISGNELTIQPSAPYWHDRYALTLKCVALYGGETYTATHTVRKQYMEGLTIEVSSSQGIACRNGHCRTTLTATVYNQGMKVDFSTLSDRYAIRWVKYRVPDMEHEVADWWQEKRDDRGQVIRKAINITQPTITLDYEISGQDCFVCELTEKK